MINGKTTMTVTKNALILRIPWDALARYLRPQIHKTHITADDVLEFVEEGRRAYKLGKTRIIHSLSELRS